jgi:prolyl 4-hydroxylase
VTALTASSTASSLAPARAFAGGQRLCESPLIHVLDALLAPEDCAHIIAAARPQMRRSQVSGAGGGKLSEGRTSARAWLKHDLDPIVQTVASRIAGCVGLPLAHAESLQVIHYEPGQEYRPHYDAYDLETEKGRRYCERGGQRLVTALAYLGEVEAGGATGFPRLGLDIQPRTGRVVVFHNCHPGTTRCDPRTYHQGKPPLRGEKWAFNLWFHERAY